MWQPTPVFLPGESLGGAWWASIYRVVSVVVVVMETILILGKCF